MHRFSSLALKSRIDARKRLFSGKSLHRFPSLGLKSRIDAAFGLFLRVSLHRFPSLALKSRIDARKRLFSGKSLHRFPSLSLKSRIDARKRLFSVKSLHRFASLGLKSRIDARWHCDDDLQAEPFSFAATKNGIGRGPRCRYDCSRRNCSPSRQRKSESDADLVAATTVAGETILLCGNEN